MLRLLMISFVALISCAGFARAEVLHFEGNVVREGAVMPIRLHLDTDRNGQSTLDIPQLWYAEEPINASFDDDGGISLAFPFGLGEFNLVHDGDTWVGVGAAVIGLQEADAPPYTKTDVSFGGAEPHVNGTFYLPEGEGPFPAVILVGGASSNQRSQWSYRSRADYYARMGVAALIYDRRDFLTPLPDGAFPGFQTQADDIIAARALLAARDDIDGDAIGLHAGSQGVWLSTIAEGQGSDFAFLIFTGVPAVTPADSQFQTTIHGMRDDGIAEEEIAKAVAYLRLYFYVAETGEGWDTLEVAMAAAEGETWFYYVDQPRTIEDLNWWHRVMTYQPREDLTRITAPILAMSGSADWIAPPEENLPLIEEYGRVAGNSFVHTMVIDGADHRLERQPFTDTDGQWHWFEVAQEARDAIPVFLREEVGLSLAN